MTALPYARNFDEAIDAERARWLRRRFVWFCVVMFLIDALFVLNSLATVADGGPGAGPEKLFLALFVPMLGLYLAAAVYARAATPRLRAFVLLSVTLTVLDGTFSLVSFHVEWRRAAAAGESGATGAWAAAAVLSVLFIHLIPCLLVPWTLREALVPAGVLVGINWATAALHVVRGELHPGVAAAVVILSAVAAAPGAFVCWVRFSRFRETFQWRFESNEYRRLQNELTSARRVHESCLPPPLPAEGPVRLSYVYEPMRQIGGDLLFVHPMPGRDAPSATGAVSAVVLDVTGHGIPAALTVNRLVGELERVFAEDPGASPGRVLAALNRYVTLTLARHEMFATALCVRADASAEGGVVEWANGGHPPAYLRRAGPGGAVEALEPTAPMLGVVDGEDFDPAPRRLPFGAGDVVVAYTDGASEAAGRDGAQLGTAGVLRLVARTSSDGLPPERWPGEILRRVCEHRGVGAAPDDDTLIVALARE